MKNYNFLDIFGYKYEFKYDGLPKFQTSLSLKVSILSYLTFIIIFLMFGQDFYLRKNPKFSNSWKKQNRNLKYLINNGNFFLSFRFEDINGTYIEMDQFLIVKTYYYQYNRNIEKSRMNLSNKSQIKNVKCSEEHVKYFSDKGNNNKYLQRNFSCFENLNHNISDSNSNKEVWFIDLQVITCVSSEENVLNNICNKNATEFEEKLSNGIYLAYTLQKNYFYFENDEYRIKDKNVHFKDKIDKNLNKKVNLFYKKINLTQDKGIIFSNENDCSFNDFDYREVDFSYNDIIDLNKKEDLYHRMSIYFNDVEIQYKLRFQKIQECIGNIFAIFRGIMTIYDILIQIYNDHAFYCFNIEKYYKNTKSKFNTISEQNFSKVSLDRKNEREMLKKDENPILKINSNSSTIRKFSNRSNEENNSEIQLKNVISNKFVTTLKEVNVGISMINIQEEIPRINNFNQRNYIGQYKIPSDFKMQCSITKNKADFKSIHDVKIFKNKIQNSSIFKKCLIHNLENKIEKIKRNPQDNIIHEESPNNNFIIKLAEKNNSILEYYNKNGIYEYSFCEYLLNKIKPILNDKIDPNGNHELYLSFKNEIDRKMNLLNILDV